MRRKFNTFEYVNDLGKDLVREFEKSGKTAHPHSVGGGREKSSIDKLKDILPSGIGIGSGFVFDSYGNISSQCDIIIYEKDLCLIFNSSDEKNSYYNCESVIAVGEVKSDLSTKELLDSLKKIKKIKNLKRNFNDNRVFRKYLSKSGIYGAESEIYDQIKNPLDQIFAFVICNSFKLSYESIISTIRNNKNKYEYPNTILSIEGDLIGYSKKQNDILTNELSATYAEFINYAKIDSSFGQLLEKIFYVIESGRSVSYNPRIYILEESSFKAELFPICIKSEDKNQ